MPSTAPWAWRPSAAGLHARLVDAATTWRGSHGVEVEAAQLTEVVGRAADEEAGWLWHPCLERLSSTAAPASRDAQLVAWLADHTDLALGCLVVEQPTVVWTRAGRSELPAGRHRLGRQQVTGPDDDDMQVSPDVWSDSVGGTVTEGWAGAPPASDEEWHSLRNGLGVLLGARQVIREQLPEVWAWLAPVVPVVVPLRPDRGRFRSGSDPAVPGLVRVDCHQSLQVLEGLIHEAAHEYLFRCEVPVPLTDPHDPARYASPLRPDPRPLRGILMAYHALAYICALYTELAERRVFDPTALEHEMVRLRHEATEAGTTLHRHRARLTRAGAEFVERTDDVLRHSAA